jgi:hypothetical protein
MEPQGNTQRLSRMVSNLNFLWAQARDVFGSGQRTRFSKVATHRFAAFAIHGLQQVAAK